jgi:hypothetical protein
MKEQVQLFLSVEDEIALSEALRQLRPQMHFLDGNRWPTAKPVTASSIDKCATNYAYLWDSSIVKDLPYLLREDGQCEGPQSGCVLEIWRSRPSDNLLLAGRFAQCVAHADPAVEASLHRLARDVWDVIKRMTKQPLVVVDPTTFQVIQTRVSNYRAGDGAIAWARRSPKNLLSTHIVNAFFKPA